jgi:murein DD-endopeptidase MepM/ murein hydrolase activator NlpD
MDNIVTMPVYEKPELFPINKGEYDGLPFTIREKRVSPVNKKDTVIHYGFDIEAKLGTVVMATAGGKVIKASWDDKGFGNLVVIDHGEGYQSWYAHLQDFSVNNGDPVVKGQTIGHVGKSGISTGPHLHFEIRLNGTSVDPMIYLK